MNNKQTIKITWINVWLGGVILFSLFLHNHTQAQTLEEEYEQAIQYFNDEKSKEGFEMLDQILSKSPNFEEARFARSYYAMQAGNYLDALQDYHYLIKQNPSEAENYLYRGQAYLLLEMLAEAEENYLLAYQLDSTQVAHSNALGSLYFFMGLHKDAQYFLQKSIALDAKDPLAYYYKAYSLYETQDLEIAFEQISQYLTLSANEIDGQRLKAMILIAQNKPSSAIAIFDALERQDTTQFEEEDFFYWGKAYYLQRKYEEAKFYLELPENPTYLPIYYYLAKVYYHLNQSEKALQLFNQVIAASIDLDPEEIAPVYYDRAIVLAQQNKLEAAIEDFEQALYFMPELVQQKDTQGNTLPLLGNALSLLQLKTPSEQVDAMLVKGYQARAERWIALGDSNQALAACQLALRIVPNDVRSLTLQAIAQLLKRSYSEALQILNQAQNKATQQELVEVFYVKILLYKAQNQPDSVQAYLEKALAINPNKTQLLQEKANYLAEKGDFAQALATINKALQQEVNNADFLNDRASFYLELEQYEACVADCGEVLKQIPLDPQALYQRGLAYKELAMYQEAYYDFEEILVLYPNEGAIEALLLEVEKKIKP